MGKLSKPKAPDPKETAAAQTSTNIASTLANTAMSNVNQVTPDGSLSYDQTGTYKFTDPNSGQVYDLPTYTATQTLSADQQAIKDSQNRTSLGLSNLAGDQVDRLGPLLSSPVDLSNDEIEGRIMELGRKRLDPLLEEQRQGLEARLSQKGIKAGSDLYAKEMERFGRTTNDANNDLLLDARQQSISEILAKRNQPINEISALASGGQVSQPNFVPTKSASMPTVDVAGLINKNYETEMSRFNSTMGGLFGVASAGIGAL